MARARSPPRSPSGAHQPLSSAIQVLPRSSSMATRHRNGHSCWWASPSTGRPAPRSKVSSIRAPRTCSMSEWPPDTRSGKPRTWRSSTRASDRLTSAAGVVSPVRMSSRSVAIPVRRASVRSRPEEVVVRPLLRPPDERLAEVVGDAGQDLVTGHGASALLLRPDPGGRTGRIPGGTEAHHTRTWIGWRPGRGGDRRGGAVRGSRRVTRILTRAGRRRSTAGRRGRCRSARRSAMPSGP